jgi:hypothetical protein
MTRGRKTGRVGGVGRGGFGMMMAIARGDVLSELDR